MPTDEDKYPSETGRRRFVKGVVGGAALAGVGAGGAAAINTATSPTGAGGGITQFVGIENTGGPAPRGMPQIPIEIDDEGYLKGFWPEVETITNEQGTEEQVARAEIGSVTYSNEWFQYCGVQTFPGVRPGFDSDNYFLSASSPPYDWQSEELSEGDKIPVSAFDDYEDWNNDIGDPGLGKPAMVTWRSEGLPPQETMAVQVLRSTKIEELAENDSGQLGTWLEETTEKGFIAWLNKCTHFCCVPGFKSIAGSAKFGGENRVYCPCHQSIYDPFNPIQESFVALPRPEPDEGSGGGSGGGGGGGGE